MSFSLLGIIRSMGRCLVAGNLLRVSAWIEASFKRVLSLQGIFGTSKQKACVFMRMSLLSVFESRLILPQSHPHPSGTNFYSSARLSLDEYPHSTELRASIAI